MVTNAKQRTEQEHGVSPRPERLQIQSDRRRSRPQNALEGEKVRILAHQVWATPVSQLPVTPLQLFVFCEFQLQ